MVCFLSKSQLFSFIFDIKTTNDPILAGCDPILPKQLNRIHHVQFMVAFDTNEIRIFCFDIFKTSIQSVYCAKMTTCMIFIIKIITKFCFFIRFYTFDYIIKTFDRNILKQQLPGHF
jgi:hypothetical protein